MKRIMLLIDVKKSLLLFFLLFTACGGGGGSSSPVDPIEIISAEIISFTLTNSVDAELQGLTTTATLKNTGDVVLYNVRWAVRAVGGGGCGGTLADIKVGETLATNLCGTHGGEMPGTTVDVTFTFTSETGDVLDTETQSIAIPL